MRRRYIVVLDIDYREGEEIEGLNQMAEWIGAALDAARPIWQADAAVYWTLEDALTDRDQGIAADLQASDP